MLTVSDETGISGDSATQTITVQGSSTPVVADFKTEVTNGTNVQFTDLSSGFGITSWVWDFGDGSTSTERNPKHTYLKEGTYQVSLTVSNGSYENTAKKPIGIR
jgi:PKD repeat protein